MDYRDFLMTSVDLTKESFLKYCERAFERFFTNETNSMPTNELYDLLCKENIFRRALVQQIIDMFDEDGSDSIQFEELVDVFLKYLGNEITPTVTYPEVREHIEKRFETTLKDSNE